jgi:hypothetical protein
MDPKLARSPRVEVVLRPVRYRGKPYGIGSVIETADFNHRGALLCNGCKLVDSDTPLKEVEPGKSKNLKETNPPAKKAAKRGRKPKAEKVEEAPDEFTG